MRSGLVSGGWVRWTRAATSLVALTLALGSASPATALDEYRTDQFGTDGFDEAQAVAADGLGFIVGGHLSDWEEAFVRRYDHDGTLLWTNQFGTQRTEVMGVAADDAGVTVSGATTGSLDGANEGAADAFVRPFRPPG